MRSLLLVPLLALCACGDSPDSERHPPNGATVPDRDAASNVDASLAFDANTGVVVQVARNEVARRNTLSFGATHTQYSLDDFGHADSIARGMSVLQTSTRIQNQHIMGWGVLNPEPSPGVFDWSRLDERVQLMRDAGGTKVITLCCAPDWMKGGTPGETDWNKLEWAPLPEHFDDFAALSREVALRYPDVEYFQVWNELKGFYDPTRNGWDREGYTALYNAVYTAVKSARPDAKLGGPYVPMDSWSTADISHPSSVRGAWGVMDGRALEAIDYWLANAVGADFVTVDGGIGTKDGLVVGDPFLASEKFTAIANWMRERTELPLWWAEWYAMAPDAVPDATRDTALMTDSLIQMANAGYSTVLMWGPQGDVHGAGWPAALFSDTRVATGGNATAFAHAAELLSTAFPPGTALCPVTVSKPSVSVLASSTETLLVNRTASPVSVLVDGTVVVSLAAYAVHRL